MQLGYLRARFTSDLVPVDGKARLVIKIDDEGPRATLAAIDVNGAERNAADAVLALCDLHRGQSIDLARLEQAQSALWESGRFTRHVLKLQPETGLQDARPGAVRLRIDLREHLSVPKLTEPLPEVEQVLLRTRGWLERLCNADQELSVNLAWRGARVQAVVSGQRGLVGRFGLRSLTTLPATTRPATTRPLPTQPSDRDVGLIINGLNIIAYDPSVGSNFSLRLPRDTRWGIVAHYTPNFDESGDRWRRMTLNAGFTTAFDDRPEEGRVTTVHLVIAPVMVLDWAHQPDNQLEAARRRAVGDNAMGQAIDLADGSFPYRSGNRTNHRL
jgi:hypothetical protein